MINPNALYFKQAAMMLGPSEAMRHLEIAEEAVYGFHDQEPDYTICSLFTWTDTPQGWDFWNLIQEATLDLIEDVNGDRYVT